MDKGERKERGGEKEGDKEGKVKKVRKTLIFIEYCL